VNANGSVTLLVKQAGSATAETLARRLRAAGLTLVVVKTPYDAVTEAARLGTPVQYLVVGVDFFDAEAFRLVPLFRREWPTTTLVAYHSPGFEHKGGIARLVGADVVLSRPEELQDFLDAVSRPAEPAAAPRPIEASPTPSQQRPARAAATETPPAEAPPRPEREAAPTGPVPREQASATRRTPPTETGPAAQDRPLPVPAAEEDIENLDGDEALEGRRILGTVELTDEELRILLGEEEDET